MSTTCYVLDIQSTKCLLVTRTTLSRNTRMSQLAVSFQCASCLLTQLRYRCGVVRQSEHGADKTRSWSMIGGSSCRSRPELIQMEETVSEPKLILVFSGKRKSGKDYVTDLIHERLGAEVCCVLRLSGPLKQQYAQEHALDLDQLLGTGPYKEQYRADMICWGESRRRQDPGFFCCLATRGARQPVWVVSDARRLSDLQWFWSKFPQQTRTVRVQCSENTRRQRGWSFTPGVDDAESECGLDSGVKFDWLITNEADAPSLEEQVQPILRQALEAADQR